MAVIRSSQILFRYACATLLLLVMSISLKTKQTKKMKIVNDIFSEIGTIEEFICPKCDKEFTIKDKLKDHVKICDFKLADSIPKYEENVCSICDYTTTNLKQFRKHMKIMHKKKKGGICTLCDFTWTRYKNLEQHFMIHHKGRKSS